MVGSARNRWLVTDYSFLRAAPNILVCVNDRRNLSTKWGATLTNGWAWRLPANLCHGLVRRISHAWATEPRPHSPGPGWRLWQGIRGHTHAQWAAQERRSLWGNTWYKTATQYSDYSGDAKNLVTTAGSQNEASINVKWFALSCKNYVHPEGHSLPFIPP